MFKEALLRLTHIVPQVAEAVRVLEDLAALCNFLDGLHQELQLFLRVLLQVVQ